MPRTPVPVRAGRSFGDVLRAVLAAVALAVLVVGVPAALAYFIGWPLPHVMPSLDMLRHEITFGVFERVLALAVWVAWAQFTACVLVEAKAAVSGVGMPARVPGAGPSQLLARNLIASLLLLTSSAAGFVPGISAIGDGFVAQHHAQRPAATAQQTPGQAHQARSEGRLGAGEQQADAVAPGTTQGDTAHKDTKFYRIQPPEGRHHDTLWGVAQRHLGDGKRYKEIYRLNRDREQPDGSKLTEASLIRPGWIMEMPADAHGGELVEMPDEAPKVSPQARQQIADYEQVGAQARQASADADGPRVAAHQVDEPTTALKRSDLVKERQEQAGAEAVAKAEAADHAGEAISASSSFGLPQALIGSPLLAAGLLAALGRRRRQALWQSVGGAARRGVGHEFGPPPGDATDVRDALLAGADPTAVRFLDRALRALSAALAADGRPLPAVHAAWLAADSLHLQLAAPAGRPPQPWKPGQGPTFWAVDRAEVMDHAPYPGDVPAPFPGLVSLGTLAGTRLLLNLESAPGLVSLAGADERRAAVLASVAAELGTSGWSDRMAVTLVGFGHELAALAPDRMRHLPDVAGLLQTMEAETTARRNRLRGSGQDSVLTGRVAPTGGEQWAPHLVLIGTEPSDEQLRRLTALATGADALGIGYVVGTGRSELPGAVWPFVVDGEGRLTAEVMGLELQAQSLPEKDRAAVVELFTSAEDDQADERPTDSRTPGFTVDLSEQGRPAVYVRLMGGYGIVGLDEPDGVRSPLLREALALLLLHREGVHPQVLTSALWPRGVTRDVRDALVERLRGWLGHGPDGRPLLRRDDAGRFVLSRAVVCDWDVLRTLHHVTGAAGEAPARPSHERRQRLREALDLARGPLLADRPQGRYGWLAHEIVDAQLPAVAAEVGLALAGEYLAVGDPARALSAVRTALVTAGSDERLWNAFVRAAHATGDEAEVARVVEWLTETNRRLHGARGLPARTEALLDELTPSWRSQESAAG